MDGYLELTRDSPPAWILPQELELPPPPCPPPYPSPQLCSPVPTLGMSPIPGLELEEMEGAPIPGFELQDTTHGSSGMRRHGGGVAMAIVAVAMATGRSRA